MQNRSIWTNIETLITLAAEFFRYPKNLFGKTDEIGRLFMDAPVVTNVSCGIIQPASLNFVIALNSSYKLDNWTFGLLDKKRQLLWSTGSKL